MFGLFFVWLWRGRDDRAVLAPKNSWQPPRELSPAQVATLIDNSCDRRDIVGTLVDLAARGYIRIEEACPGDLVLMRGERLRRHERLFMSALFDPQPPDIERGRRPANTALSDEPWNETALSLLRNKFYHHLPDIEAEIYRSLMAEGFFFSDSKAVRVFFSTVGTWLFVFGFYALRKSLDRTDMGLEHGAVVFCRVMRLRLLGVWRPAGRLVKPDTGGLIPPVEQQSTRKKTTIEHGLIAFPLGVVLSGAIWGAVPIGVVRPFNASVAVSFPMCGPVSFILWWGPHSIGGLRQSEPL